MEEASSIAKAIETAWNRAGQPTEFSVKVLELPETSFFGLKTSKSAKVAFFFNEATVTVRPRESGQRHEASGDRHAPRQSNQRPVTLRQPGTKSESSDQQRRPHNRYDRGSQETRESADRQDNRPSREPREPREQPDYAKASTDRRDNRTAENRDSYEQRPDHRNRPQGPRRSDYVKNGVYPERAPRVEGSDRSDYAKPVDSRSGVNTTSAHPALPSEASREGREEHRSDSRRTSERAEQGHRRTDDRRPRHSEERPEQSSYSQEPRENWTPEMAQFAQEWIKETLVLMGKPDITVDTQVSHNYLKVNLSAPVLEDPRQEETQLKSWAMLAMEAVREKAGKSLRSLRIILESNK